MPFFDKVTPTEEEIAQHIYPEIERMINGIDSKKAKNYKETIHPIVELSTFVAKALEPYPSLKPKKVMERVLALYHENDNKHSTLTG